MKKSVLPSLPVNTYELGVRYSKILADYQAEPAVISPSSGYDTRLINGERLRLLDEKPGEDIDKDQYVASTCFVLKTEEFSFSKGTKRALKVTIDSDGYISEKVLWPDYNTGDLIYPKELKKNCIATFFFRKKAQSQKKDMSIMGVVVESY